MKALYSVVAFVLCTGIASANVTVNGQGKVSYVPDLGTITVGVSSKGATALEAWNKNNVLIEQLFLALKEHGIDPKDIQTTNLAVTPQYLHPKDKEPVLVGYVASYDLRITVRKLDALAGVLDDLVKAGVNRNVTLAFGCADLEKLTDEARVKAATDARRKAGMYVAAAGGKLGRVLSISEDQLHYPQAPQYRLAMLESSKDAAPALQLAQGKQEVSVTVAVVFALSQD